MSIPGTKPTFACPSSEDSRTEPTRIGRWRQAETEHQAERATDIQTAACRDRLDRGRRFRFSLHDTASLPNTDPHHVKGSPHSSSREAPLTTLAALMLP